MKYIIKHTYTSGQLCFPSTPGTHVTEFDTEVNSHEYCSDDLTPLSIEEYFQKLQTGFVTTEDKKRAIIGLNYITAPISFNICDDMYKAMKAGVNMFSDDMFLKSITAEFKNDKFCELTTEKLDGTKYTSFIFPKEKKSWFSFFRKKSV